MNCLSVLVVSLFFIACFSSYGSPYCLDKADFLSYTGTDLSTARAYYNHRLKVTVGSNNLWYTLPYRIGVCNPAGYPTSSNGYIKYTCSTDGKEVTKTYYTDATCATVDTNTQATTSNTTAASYSSDGWSCTQTKDSTKYYATIEMAVQDDLSNLKCKTDGDSNVKSLDIQIMTGVCFKFNDTMTYNKIFAWKQNKRDKGDIYFGQVQGYYDTACTNATNGRKALVIEDMCDSTSAFIREANINASMALVATEVIAECSNSNMISMVFSVIFVAVIAAIFG